MRQYAKWNRQQRNLEVGEIVLIGDDHVPIAVWPMGVVTEVFKGPDDIVRVATVRTSTGIYKRNVRVLAPLPIERHLLLETPEDDVPKDMEATPECTQYASDENDNTVAEAAPPKAAEMEDDEPPRAPDTIWDGRLRPKGGRKWK